MCRVDSLKSGREIQPAQWPARCKAAVSSPRSIISSAPRLRRVVSFLPSSHCFSPCSSRPGDSRILSAAREPSASTCPRDTSYSSQPHPITTPTPGRSRRRSLFVSAHPASSPCLAQVLPKNKAITVSSAHGRVHEQSQPQIPKNLLLCCKDGCLPSEPR